MNGSANWPFGDLRPLSYDVIMADPPWKFRNWSKAGEEKNASAHYDCMELEEIKALPVGHLARGAAVLFLWATWPMLREALEVVDAWDARYITGGAWHKRTKTGKSAFGTGYVQRSSTEPYLIAAFGRPSYGSKSERNVIEMEIDSAVDELARDHSRKPDAAYAMLERLYPQLKFLDLFSRETRPGWDAWGNQAGKFDGGTD